MPTLAPSALWVFVQHLGSVKRSDPRERTCSPPGAAPQDHHRLLGGNASFLAQVFLSTRRGAWILNRVGDQGYPIDIILTTRMKAFLKELLSPSMVCNLAEKQLNARFDHSHYGLKPKHRCQQNLPLSQRDPPGSPMSSSARPFPCSLCPGWG